MKPNFYKQGFEPEVINTLVELISKKMLEKQPTAKDLGNAIEELERAKILGNYFKADAQIVKEIAQGILASASASEDDKDFAKDALEVYCIPPKQINCKEEYPWLYEVKSAQIMHGWSPKAEDRHNKYVIAFQKDEMDKLAFQKNPNL